MPVAPEDYEGPEPTVVGSILQDNVTEPGVERTSYDTDLEDSVHGAPIPEPEPDEPEDLSADPEPEPEPAALTGDATPPPDATDPTAALPPQGQPT